MKIKNTGLAFTMCCLGSLVATNVGQAALTQIAVSANSGVSGLTSTEYQTAGTDGQGNPVVADPQGNRSTTWAGNWTATIVSGDRPSGAPAYGDPWQTFCMDIGNSMGNSTYNFTASAFALGNPPAGNGTGGFPPDPKWVEGGGAKAGYLYNLHLIDMTGASGTARLIARSALAISIWEVLYESSSTYSVSSHNAVKGFQVVSDGTANANNAITMANSWLTTAMGLDFASAPSSTWWKEDSTSNAQSLIGTPTAVPEPSTYVASGLLLLPFLASLIRRRVKVS